MEAGAARLRQAARARGLLYGGAPVAGSGAPSLGGLAQLLDPGAGAMQALIRRLDREAGADVAELVSAALTRTAGQLRRDHARIVFGGHVGSGKSTLINMLLGAGLLPTSDYPETGVPCVIRAGYANTVNARIREGLFTVPFSTESIARYVSLIGGEGRLPRGRPQVQRAPRHRGGQRCSGRRWSGSTRRGSAIRRR